METKLFEIRDRGTCVPAMATLVSRDDGPILRRAGYEQPLVLLTQLAKPQTEYDPWAWGNVRTMTTAHNHIQERWSDLKDGQVIDVRVILREAEEAAEAECR